MRRLSAGMVKEAMRHVAVEIAVKRGQPREDASIEVELREADMSAREKMDLDELAQHMADHLQKALDA